MAAVNYNSASEAKISDAVASVGKGTGNSIPTWKGSGPAPGTIGVNANSKSVGALNNYYPKDGAIEFVFDSKINTFVVGKPKSGMFNGSPHEQLAQSIKADTSTVVGGMFKRGANGEILTNEFSGHYWQNWIPEVRQQFTNTMNQYGIKVTHSEGMLP